MVIIDRTRHQRFRNHRSGESSAGFVLDILSDRDLDSAPSEPARALTAGIPSGGVELDLEVFTLAELLRLLALSRAQGSIEVTTPRLSGTVRVVGDGRAAAWCGGLSGLDAALALFELEDGTLHYQRETRGGPSSSTTGRETFVIEEALLQSSWLEDELCRRAHAIPGPDDLLEVCREASRPSGDSELPLRGIFDIVEHTAPVSLDDLQQLDLCAPRRLRLAVARLIESGSIVRRAA